MITNNKEVDEEVKQRNERGQTIKGERESKTNGENEGKYRGKRRMMENNNCDN